jgi:hypothetical protein
MMSGGLDDFRYLWVDPDGDWGLLRSQPGSGEFAIYNKHGAIKLVEDVDLQRALCDRMIEAGCWILDAPAKAAAMVKPASPHKE